MKNLDNQQFTKGHSIRPREKTALQAFGLSFLCDVRQSLPISCLGYTVTNYRSLHLYISLCSMKSPLSLNFMFIK